MIPLEDLFNDIINKAQRGLGLSDEAVANAAGVSVAELQAVKSGTVEPATISKVAPVLNLDAVSLNAMAANEWIPRPVELPGLAQFNTTYDDMTVNAYLVWDSTTRQAAVFDSGADASTILSFISEKNLTLSTVFLTHTHPDHVADLPPLLANGAKLYACKKEPWAGAELFDCGAGFEIGNLSVETRQTWGHAIGGVTYVIHGLANPVAIVGDALFASSMGGGAVSYPDALATNRSEIFTLPDDTIVAAGHGPLTTVGEEKLHNPFYPEFKKH